MDEQRRSVYDIRPGDEVEIRCHSRYGGRRGRMEQTTWVGGGGAGLSEIYLVRLYAQGRARERVHGFRVGSITG